jgi:hypothetical protein
MLKILRTMTAPAKLTDFFAKFLPDSLPGVSVGYYCQTALVGELRMNKT